MFQKVLAHFWKFLGQGARLPPPHTHFSPIPLVGERLSEDLGGEEGPPRPVQAGSCCLIALEVCSFRVTVGFLY